MPRRRRIAVDLIIYISSYPYLNTFHLIITSIYIHINQNLTSTLLINSTMSPGEHKLAHGYNSELTSMFMVYASLKMIYICLGGEVLLPCDALCNIIDLDVDDITQSEIKWFVARIVLLLQVGPRVGIVGDQVGASIYIHLNTIPMPDVGVVELKIRSLDHLLVAYSDTHPAAILLNLERKYSTFISKVYVLPPLGIWGSQITNLYPFDSELFYSATELFCEREMFAPFRFGLKKNDVCENPTFSSALMICV